MKNKYLSNITGLTVIENFDANKREKYYEFKLHERTLFSCYTLRKANIFAKGIALGRTLEKEW